MATPPALPKLAPDGMPPICRACMANHGLCPACAPSVLPQLAQPAWGRMQSQDTRTQAQRRGDPMSSQAERIYNRKRAQALRRSRTRPPVRVERD